MDSSKELAGCWIHMLLQDLGFGEPLWRWADAMRAWGCQGVSPGLAAQTPRPQMPLSRASHTTGTGDSTIPRTRPRG